MKVFKFIVFILAVLGILVGATWFSKVTGVSFSWWSAQITGMKTVDSMQYQVSASGQDLRAYSFIDTFGRNCTTVFASSTGSGLDCDFPENIK